MLFIAGLTALQIGIASAEASRLCCVLGDCDATMQCYVAPCGTSAPVPVADIELRRLPESLTEILPAHRVGQIPQGLPADIWRPPRG